MVRVGRGGFVAGSDRACGGRPRWCVEMVEADSVTSKFRIGDWENLSRGCNWTERGDMGTIVRDFDDDEYGNATPYGMGPGNLLENGLGGVRGPAEDGGEIEPMDNAGVEGIGVP